MLAGDNTPSVPCCYPRLLSPAKPCSFLSFRDQVAGLQGGVAKIEEELKGLGGAFSEKQQNVAALKRKKGGTLATANLEEILTEDVIRVGFSNKTEGSRREQRARWKAGQRKGRGRWKLVVVSGDVSHSSVRRAAGGASEGFILQNCKTDLMVSVCCVVRAITRFHSTSVVCG